MESKANISILNSEVIDQIAAGEVVERPAHMIKELVENSIDAGASEVSISVDEGGREVRVEDDGWGIPADQLKLALSRHATSKIQDANDLWALHSFGFRGEALASVASVSHLELVSKTRDSESSYRVFSEFGKIGEVDEVGGKVGTQISVSQLFENVPARKKFLKSDSGEISQIKMTIKALALSHPSVGFRFKSRGQVVFVFPKGQTYLERAKQVLGVKTLLETEGEHESYSVKLAFSPPNETFGNSRNIWLFAQGRWIQDRSLQAAVMDAYRGLLMHGEFPFVVAWLSCPPEDIDVNIHPTKSQVKFREQRQAFRAVQRNLRAALEKAPWVGGILRDSQGDAEMPAPEPVTETFHGSEFQKVQYATKSINERVESSVVPYSESVTPPVVREQVWQPSEPESNVQPKWSQLHVIGQADLTYIVAQNKDKIIFIDQHAAHERVAYERLMKAWHSGASDVQNYLIPLNMDLEEDQVDALMNLQGELMKLGVEIDRGGPSSIIIRSSLTLMKEKSIVNSLAKLAFEASEKGDGFAFESAVSDVCATMACHSVIRAGKVMSVEEMQSLLKEMDEFPLSSFCPHGRPVFVEYSFSRLERDFGRIV